MLKFIANFERSVSSEAAEEWIIAEADSIARDFGCKITHYKKGSTDIVHAALPDGSDLAYGLGKGVQSKLGAYAECLEHLLYRRIGQSDPPMPVKHLRAKQVSQLDPVLKYAFAMDDAPESLKVIDFADTTTGDIHQVPAALINHHFLDVGLTSRGMGGTRCETFLSRYVTTSGSAFGLTPDDAYLHALNETIERDTTSKLFLDMASVGRSEYCFQRLAVKSLPGYLSELCAKATTQFGLLSIELIVTRTDSNTWWSMCIARFANQDIYELPQWGAGSSSLYDLAIYRSISECIQMLDNFEVENLAADRKLMEFVTRYPRFKAISALDLATVNIVDTDYDANHNIRQTTVPAQISAITTAMQAAGHLPLRHLAYAGAEGALVCAYTPTFERFYNISKSSPVLPLSHLRTINEKQAQN